MVDIESYRARIGSFGVSGLFGTKLKLKMPRCKVQRQVSMQCSVQTLIFLCMVTSTMLCVSLRYQEQGNTYTGTTPSHTDSLYSDTQLCIKCLFEHVHELYTYILENYVDKLTEMSLFYTPSQRSSLASYIWTPGTNTQATLMENIFNGTVHGTCSYLIGNVGSHAYHGNPPKKSGPEIWDLHSDMILKLCDTLAPDTGNKDIERKWNLLTNMLHRPDLLSRVEIGGLKSMFDVFGILIEKGKIDYGNYEVIKRILSKLQLIQCLDIITEHEKKMLLTSQDEQGAAETVHSQDTIETVHSQGTTETLRSQATAAETLHSRDTAETVHRQGTAQIVLSQDTAETMYSRNTAETMHSRDTAETVHSQATAEIVHSQATAETVHSQATAKKVHSQDTAETMLSQDTAETVLSQDNEEMVYSQDTAETLFSQNTAETVYSWDTAETMHSQDTAETMHSRNTAEMVHSQIPSVARKRSRETSPQPQGSSSDSEKRLTGTQSVQGDLPIKVDVVSGSPQSSDKNHIYDAMMDVMKLILSKIVKESKTAEEMMTKLEKWFLLYEKVSVKRNCLMIYVACGSRKALTDLWRMYQSGELLEILQTGLITRDFLAKCRMESIRLGVFISEEDYRRCLRNIAEPVTTAVATITQTKGFKLESGRADTDTEMKPDITETVEKLDIRVTEGIKPKIMETKENPVIKETEDIEPDIMGIETKQDTRDTEDIQPGIMGMETKQDTRDTEDIQPVIMGIKTKQSTRDTEDIQPDIMGIKTKQDTRDTEDIQPDIMGIETQQDTRDTEDIQPDIMGIETKQDTRDTEDIQPDIMGIETQQDTRDTEDKQPDIMGIETKQDTRDTEDIQPDIMGIETQQDTRDTEDIQPGIMGIETKQDTRDTEDIQPGIIGMETQQDTRDTEDIQPDIMGIVTQQDTSDTEDIQPGIMGIKTKQDTRDTEDIQPGIMGIETKQDTRDTEDIQPGITGMETKKDSRDIEEIQPGIMGMETKKDTRDIEDIQPEIMGIETKQDTRDTEDIQPGIMGIETKQDTRDTEDIQPSIMGIETKQDTRDTEDIQPGIMGIETKHDTMDTEDIQPDIMGMESKQDIQSNIIGMETQQDIEDTNAGECSIDTSLFKEDNNMDTAVEKDITETGQDFKEWVSPTAGIAEQLIVKREEFRTSQEDVVDVLAQHAAGFGAGETVYSRDTAASSHKMPSGEEPRRLHEVVDALARHAYATGFGAAETVYSQDTAASSHNKMPSVDMEASVKVWGDNEKLCYETKGIKDVVQKIYSEEHSYICVVGEPGCGKSTAIRHAALYLKDKLGFIIYPVSGPKQFIDYLDPDKPQVFMFDDFCGEYFIDQDKLKAWGEYNEKIKDCLQVHKNTKVLFSLRVQLHSELKSKGNTHIYNDQRHIINFSDKEYKLSRDTMQDMLRHYLQVQHVQNIKGLIRRVWWGRAEQFAGCFPLLCKVFSEDESVRVDPEKYFSDPWPALQNIFKCIKSDNKHQFCGLLLCGVTDLKDEYFSTSYKQNKPQQFDSLIESQNLDPRKDLSDIKSALQALDGVYISHIGNRYTFLHSIFQNIVTFLYDDKYYVFKYATLDFIHTRVRLFSKFDTDDDYVKVFYGDDCVELLVDRMIEELRSDDRDRWRWWGVRFIVKSHYIDNKELITCLMEKLFDSKHTQITQNKIHRLFVECLRTVCWYTPSPPHTDVTSCPQYQLLLSLIARCDCNKQIEGSYGWWYPLLLSVDFGTLPVTKALVEHQADVNVVDKYKRCVLHWAVDCDNNVDMTKYLLSLPNLKCLNHRDSDGHTPYWYVVNNKSPLYGYDDDDVRHRDELMELYKHTAAICE